MANKSRAFHIEHGHFWYRQIHERNAELAQWQFSFSISSFSFFGCPGLLSLSGCIMIEKGENALLYFYAIKGASAYKDAPKIKLLERGGGCMNPDKRVFDASKSKSDKN